MNETTALHDPILMEVFSNRLLSVTEEMGHTLVRSSFSTNIKERKDCSVALFDAEGRLAAQAAHVPLHLGSLMGGVQAALALVPVAEMVEGDAFVCNDPYAAGGTHTPDISVVTPLFHDGRVGFFAANIGHHADVGGSVPGSISGQSRTIYEEGLRIPAVHVARAGALEHDVIDLIALNSRDAVERRLDLQVQVATNERGRELVADLILEMGLPAVERALDDLLAYTHRRLARRVAALPDGRHLGEASLDDDGFVGRAVRIAVEVEVSGEDLTIDFTRTGEQARGAMNVAPSATHATVYYCVKALLDPDLAPNSGMFRAIRVVLPSASLVNPDAPAACGARSITCNKIARALFRAFAPLLPAERAMAAGHDIVPAIVYSGPRPADGEPFVYLETVGGGGGATLDADGMEAIQMHMTNTSNLPAEALEHEYCLRVVEYALVEDSGGAGTRRGGLGIAREIAATRDGIVFSARSDGHETGAPGLDGGGEGARARMLYRRRNGAEEELSSKPSRIVLSAGESIRMETPGGGGLGDPGARPAAALARDLADGKLHETGAYGEVLASRARDLIERAHLAQDEDGHTDGF